MFGILNLARRLRRNERGNIALVAALAMPVVLGSVGLGAEAASWYNGKRSLQNAADSAAIAAATNATPNGYDDEARAVAGAYGLRNGVDGVTVTATDNVTCPDGGGNCYRVTITKAQPLMLAQVVGFAGDTQVNGAPAKLLTATALAIQVNAPRDYCILALAGSGASEGIRANGSPDADLTGCRIMSNTDSNCNGHSLLADQGDAHGSADYCGRRNISKVPTVSDPYAGLRANIPSDPCSTYYKAPAKKSDPDLPSTNTLHGIENRKFIDICGDVELNGPVFLQSNADTVLIIRNGTLDLKGYTLQANAASGLTIIFTGKASGRSHFPIGSGAFDFRAPTTGPWKGIAIYQDPQTTSGVDFDFAGNSPTWDITGLVYAPKAAVGFSGIINKATNGASCFGLVIDHLLVNGTARILAHGECPAAGLELPYSQQPGRGQLVG